MPLASILAFAQQQIAAVLPAGALTLDATLGNGHDTLFLAQHVGPSGHVFGFDVQAAALETTRQRLADAGLLDRATLFQQGHEHLAAALPAEHHGQLRAAMFNLGYLPGSDKSCITQPATTLRALDAVLPLLAPGGRLSVVLYAGHPGGAAEAAAVQQWAEGLPSPGFSVLSYAFVNRKGIPPRLLLVEKGDALRGGRESGSRRIGERENRGAGESGSGRVGERENRGAGESGSGRIGERENRGAGGEGKVRT